MQPDGQIDLDYIAAHWPSLLPGERLAIRLLVRQLRAGVVEGVTIPSAGLQPRTCITILAPMSRAESLAYAEEILARKAPKPVPRPRLVKGMPVTP